MAIRLQDFINVHITRDTVISTGRNKTVAFLSSNVRPDANKPDALIYTSITEVANAKAVGTGTLLYPITGDVYKACKVFFDCGGRSILLVQVAVNLNDETTSPNIYIDAIKALPLEVVAFSVQRGTSVTVGGVTTYNGGLLDSDRINIISYLDDIEQNEGTSYRKLISLDITDLADVALQGASVNVMYKLVTAHDYSCMAILSHLSRIDLNNTASITDYCFTEERLLAPVNNTVSLVWATVGQKANVVLDIFKGVPTNFGGNTGGGTDLVEEYMSIFISQDILLTEVDLLRAKLRTDNAITRVHSALIRVLEVYYNAGFLVQSLYTGEDIIVNKNGVNYKVLAKNSMLTGGYIINILPITSRNEAEIANKSLPDVHLIFNTVKGIRHINNVGKII